MTLLGIAEKSDDEQPQSSAYSLQERALADQARDKQQVQDAVLKHLGMKELQTAKNQAGKDVFRFRDDAYDALALAICHVLKSRAL